MARSSQNHPKPLDCSEQRKESRISYRLDFTVCDTDLWSSNVSKNGAQLCCPVMRYSGLEKMREQKISAFWTLPGTKKAIKASAEIRYANVCDDEVLIGLEFISFEENSKSDWDDFIDSLAEQRATRLA